MNCPKCNAEIPENNQFCGNCGKETDDSYPPGKNFIKITSIIGVILLAISGCTIGCVAMVMENLDDINQELANMGIYENPFDEFVDVLTRNKLLLMMVSLAIGLYVYIMGWLHCANLEKAHLLKNIITIYIIIKIVEILSNIRNFDSFTLLFTMTFTLVLPVLYYLGVQKNIDEYNNQAYYEDNEPSDEDQSED